jgi:hypothetical protein
MSNIRFNHCRPVEHFQALDLTMFKSAYAFMDFGAAQWLPGGPGTGQTVTGYVGTEKFCAPEVERSHSLETYYDPFAADVSKPAVQTKFPLVNTFRRFTH